jgi:hypothetical protein
MSEQSNESAGTCPTWCYGTADPDESATGAAHAHVSADIEVGQDPMVVRMIQLSGSDTVRVALGDQMVAIEEAEAFAHALLRLTASARLAEPGLGFVEVLLGQMDLTTSEIATASALEVERVRAQRAGGQVLDQREFDRLVLAVAHLVSLKGASADDVQVTDAGEQDADPAVHAVDWSAVADMRELIAFAAGQAADEDPAR